MRSTTEKRKPFPLDPVPGKETYLKFKLLLGARAGFTRLFHPLLISTSQPVGLLGRQGHCEGRQVRCQALGPPRSLWLSCGACVEDPGCWGPLLSCPSAWVKTSLLSGLWNDRGCLRGDPLPGCVHAGHSGYPLGLRPPFSVLGKQPAQVSSLRPTTVSDHRAGECGQRGGFGAPRGS